MGYLSNKMVGTFIILLVLFSCQRKIQADFERTFISVNGQQFEILTAEKIFDVYLAEKPDYEHSIFQKIQLEFGNNIEYPFLLDAIRNPIIPDDKLEEELELMKNIDFVKIVDSSFQVITPKLPGPYTKILFLPANPENREFYKEFGIGFHAFTLGAGKIVVVFDPTFDNWQQLMPYALAHEYHHSVWTSRNFKTANFTPLEYLVLEGKAEAFAMKIFPNSEHPFIGMLNNNDEKRIWNLIKPHLNIGNSALNEELYYGSKAIPYGSVYAIGYNIIEAFKKNNPSVSDRELIDFPAEKVLLLSDYDNLVQRNNP